MAELGKRAEPDPRVEDPDPRWGHTPAARGYNTAVPHLRIDRHIRVNCEAPAFTKVATNPLRFRQCDH